MSPNREMKLGGIDVPPGHLVFLNTSYRYLRITAAVAKVQLEAHVDGGYLMSAVYWAGVVMIYRPMLDERIHFSPFVPEGRAWIARDDVNPLT